jgi:hypothetical protein
MHPTRYFVAALLALAACTDGADHAQAVCVLTDVSGTYADQRPDVDRVIRTGLLPRMRPRDSLVLVRIDGDSYDDANVETSVTLDGRPSRANAQKLALAGALDRLWERRLPSRHTDIRGALMLCGERLAEIPAATKVIVAFSDMKEDLPKNARRTLTAGELRGVHVVAMNVKRLDSDNRDPSRYRARLDGWAATVNAAGATEWRVVIDPERLVDYLEELAAGAGELATRDGALAAGTGALAARDEARAAVRLRGIGTETAASAAHDAEAAKLWSGHIAS